jgi:hypothetical protein
MYEIPWPRMYELIVVEIIIINKIRNAKFHFSSTKKFRIGKIEVLGR